MDAFRIEVNGKILDYRKGNTINLKEVKDHFSSAYKVINLRQNNRHALGLMEKGRRKYFLKLSTSVGIGEKTKIEFA